MYAEGTGYSLEAILAQVSWYWHTRSYGRSLWAYRAAWQGLLRDKPAGLLPSPLVITKKPLGYSWYPGEVLTVAKSWMEHWFPENLVQFNAHEKVEFPQQVVPRFKADIEKGGHFAAVDDPEGFLRDVEEFVAVVKTKVKF